MDYYYLSNIWYSFCWRKFLFCSSQHQKNALYAFTQSLISCTARRTHTQTVAITSRQPEHPLPYSVGFETHSQLPFQVFCWLNVRSTLPTLRSPARLSWLINREHNGRPCLRHHVTILGKQSIMCKTQAHHAMKAHAAKNCNLPPDCTVCPPHLGRSNNEVRRNNPEKLIFQPSAAAHGRTGV